MSSETKQILGELKVIKLELDYIKRNMVDKDMILTTKEKKLLKDSYNSEKHDKLVSSKAMRKLLA